MWVAAIEIDSLLSGLNPEQRAAVRHGEGPLMVVAGAGTGKTRVITERIRYLLETQPELDGSEILGLTFTEKAAAEMKRRVVASAGERGERVALGTFHSFCAQLLTERDPSLRTLDRFDEFLPAEAADRDVAHVPGRVEDQRHRNLRD